METIAEKWANFRALMAEDVSDEDVQIIGHAFYAGAAWALAQIATVVEATPAAGTLAEVERILKRNCDEINQTPSIERKPIVRVM